jgi:hypothetical protein
MIGLELRDILGRARIPRAQSGKKDPLLVKQVTSEGVDKSVGASAKGVFKVTQDRAVLPRSKVAHHVQKDLDQVLIMDRVRGVDRHGELPFPKGRNGSQGDRKTL